MRIEGYISEVLTKDAQKNALDFIAYLRGDEGFSTSMDSSDTGRCWIRRNDNLVCEMQVRAASGDTCEGWDVWFYGDCIGQQDSLADENIKETAWANITPCGNCGAECAPGKQKIVFGKVFENVCQSTLGFTNPDAHMLDCMKKIVETVKTTSYTA